MPPEPTVVPDIAEALRRLDLPPDIPVTDLSGEQMRAFRQLVGWEPGGPVIAYPTADERSERAERERWKADRAGTGPAEPRLWMSDTQIGTFRQNLQSDAGTQVWWSDVLDNAEAVAALPVERIADLVPDQGPWTFAGSYCPNCVGEKSPITQHAGLWRWSALDPDRLECPCCGIVYPHPDYPEDGRLDLPRLGHSYSFHISDRERKSDDWRDGRNASNFAGIPTHVSFTGEIRTVKLAWCLGQVEPLSVVYAVTGDERFARIASVILSRLADVYPDYPVFSYGQEYVDADPAYAVRHIDEMPTPFRRAASLGTYTGIYGGRTGNRGKDRTTPSTSCYDNAEWGTSRLGREKASNGQLFLSLFKGYDLVKQTLTPEERTRIEADFLLELYLDTRDLSKRVNNKSGPGAASRVAVGIVYDDREALDEGIEQFHEIMDSQFYEDGSWKETPVYGAKSMNEGLFEIPEMLRGRVDLYADTLHRRAYEAYAELATPLGTQPAVGDSPADFRLQPVLVDIARIRLGLNLGYGPESMSGFGVSSPFDIGANSGYTPSLDGIAAGEDRTHLDGPVGFGVVGHIPRRVSRPSWIGMFNQRLPAPDPETRPAVNRHCAERNLVCLGYGAGERAVQLYCDAGDGRKTHRHHAPLNLLLFAGGREVFPDLGYIGDHPANAWIKSTPSHNTVVVDERSSRPPTRVERLGFIGDGPCRFLDFRIEIPLPDDGGDCTLRRAVALIEKPDGQPVLVDVFDVAGGSCHDYIVRINHAENDFDPGPLRLRDRAPVYTGVADPGPYRFRTAGALRDPVTVAWGGSRACVLTPVDEALVFASPAWRDRTEAFAEPCRSWEALALRNRASTSRYVVVYDIGSPWVMRAERTEKGSDVGVTLATPDGERSIVIGHGTCRLT